MDEDLVAMKCTSCGNVGCTLIARFLHMETFRCIACGAEFHYRVFYPDPDAQPLEPHRSTRVYLCWNKGRPTAAEIIAVRKLHPKFAALPLSEIIATKGQQAEWEIGMYYKNEAKLLEAKATELGLHVRCEQCEDHEDQ